ncbi:hypothetical protein [Yinghuangia soli]|uniref:Uncharacterized protein n=1 Tax=Yinghuangia soli TaxID=2908204 RepID=A0AA41PWI9_9ACTN|nr:hypothetical protein [Yinghuangia soli]MCF2527134.1 hypothetical protein [Yinghuangia soli]
MSFFEGLVAADPEPEPPMPQAHYLVRYTPPDEGHGEEHPPNHWLAPAWVPHPAEAGRGPDVRIRLDGWEVWRCSATLRLTVFRRVTENHGGMFTSVHQRTASGLRFGPLLGDGRRVTTRRRGRAGGSLCTVVALPASDSNPGIGPG